MSVSDGSLSDREDSEPKGCVPAYTYVPGGKHPHPPSEHTRQKPICEDDWALSEAYLRGVQLFETGYYWEAHEVWEGLWHAHGRSGPTADALKALIKLAAAGVKVLQGQRHGVVIHASRASALFDRVSFDVGKTLLGLDLDELAKITRGLAENPPVPEPDFSGSPQKVFTFSLKPTHTHPTNKAEE